MIHPLQLLDLLLYPQTPVFITLCSLAPPWALAHVKHGEAVDAIDLLNS